MTDLVKLAQDRSKDPSLCPPPDASILFEVMDQSGDTKQIWNKENADEVEAAKRQFDYFVKERKFAAFYVTGKDGDKGEQMRSFDPKAERVIFVPPLAGG